MLDLDFEPEMVGREESLEELQAYLEMVADGFGSTVLLSGEAGIGKTRLVEELVGEAESRGFQVLTGCCLHESLTSYMPFLEALRSGEMEHLFSEEAPKVEGVYLVTKTGLLIKEVIREETELDPDLFSSMLITVGDFVRDSLAQLSGQDIRDTLNQLGYGDYTILIESGKHTHLVVILTGEGNEFLIDDMRSALFRIDRRYGEVLEAWDGDEQQLEGLEMFLRPMIMSGKYDGIYYGKSDPQSRRNLLFENVSLGLTRRSQNIPTVLCLEDLQWADPSSLALMHYVARNSRKSNLMILGTYRPEDVSVKEGEYHPLVETMQLMSREELYERVDLERLCDDCLPDFLRSILGKIDFGDEFTQRVYEETEGNPLYIIELVKLLVDEGVIAKENDVWKLTKHLEEVTIPSKIHDVIVRRLNRVGSGGRKVLDYASVIGVVFTSEVLHGALDIEKLELLERLKVLERTHNLIHSHDGGYRFDHAMVREVLYDEIPGELRMEYHAIIASSIETLYKDNLGEVIGDLAFHCKHCSDKGKASVYLTKAAEEAKKSYSNEEAIRFYSESLEFEEDSEKRASILTKLGCVYELIGDYDKSLAAYRDALELVQDPKRKAGIWSKIGSVHDNKGEYEESTSAYAEAFDIVKGDRSETEADVVLGIGNVHWCKGEFEEALGCYQSALEIAEKVGDQMIIAASMTNIGNIHVNKGEYEDALEGYQKSLELRESAGDERRTAHTLGNIGALHYNKGEYEKALEYYERSLEILEKIGDQQGIAISLNNIGVLHEDRGEYEKALGTYEKSLEILEKIGDQAVIASSLHNIGLVHRYLGDLDLALENFEKSMEMCVKIGYPIGVAFNSAGIAEVYLEKKDLENALAFCNRAFESAEEMGVKEYSATSRRIYGMIFRERQEWDKSIENFDESIRMFGEMERDKELGESHYEFGLMWKMKNDFDKAKEHLGKANEIFQSLALNKELEEAREALRDLE